MADTATGNETWVKWHSELEMAAKARGFTDWQKRSKKIIKRYRDERGDAVADADNAVASGTRFNILWSNVQTLQPALFAKAPKPVVDRRYLDRDDVGRTASIILERALLYELDEGNMAQAISRAVLDRLLPGRGVVWVRYEPKFSDMPAKTQESKDEPGEAPEDQEAKPDKTAPENTTGDESLTMPGGLTEETQEVVAESTPVDYIDWTDFMTSPARTWEEVWWVSKRVYMSREELVARFGAKIGEQVPLDWSPNDANKSAPGTPPSGNVDGQKRAKVLEIWDKTERKVYWMAEQWGDTMLDEKPDPLKLADFWPLPKPLFATTTNDTLVPVPDFYEYQDQANELDDLTSRISSLTKAIKAAGIYDASVPELQRMLEEGFENKLVPCDNMAELSTKMGPTGQGAIWLLPVKDMVFTLNELYQAREAVKQSLYEITGISDIIRGNATGGGSTATEQRIKGQFATMRLNQMQAEVARFCRDTLRIMGEIIAEHFDPMTLFMVSSFEQYAKEQWPPESAPNPMMGHNGGPPMAPGAPAAAQGQPAPGPMMHLGMMGMLPPDPVAVAQAKAVDMFKQAVALIKNDKLRGFRIDIETDSIIEPDQKATQDSRTEFLAAAGQFLAQAVPLAQEMPALKPLMGRMLLFGVRGFRAGRDLETAFEQAIDDMTKEAANPAPKPPSPDEIKAQTAQLEQQGENQRIQAQAQIDQQNQQGEMARQQQDAQQQFALAQQKAQIELQALQANLDFDRQRNAMQLQILQADLNAKLKMTAVNAMVDTHAAVLDAASTQQQHENTMEAAKAKPEAQT